MTAVRLRTVVKAGEFSRERTALWQAARFWGAAVPALDWILKGSVTMLDEAKPLIAAIKQATEKAVEEREK